MALCSGVSLLMGQCSCMRLQPCEHRRVLVGVGGVHQRLVGRDGLQIRLGHVELLDGWRLRLEGVAPGGRDHFLQLQVRTDEGLRVDGLRVLYRLDLPAPEGALGGSAAGAPQWATAGAAEGLPEGVVTLRV